MKPQIIDSNFEEIAVSMIAKKKHARYMKHALKQYHAYTQFMSQAFLEGPNNDILTFRATYRLKKVLWREIEIRGTQTLAELATAIVESMGWVEDHLHGFWLPDKRRNRIFGDYGIYHEGFDDDPHPWFKSKDIPVSQIDWKRYPIIGFMFDFGDGHAFDVTFKKMRKKEKSDAKLGFSRLVDQRGIAPEQYPPYDDAHEDVDENVGGPIEDFLFDDCPTCQELRKTSTPGKAFPRD